MTHCHLCHPSVTHRSIHSAQNLVTASTTDAYWYRYDSPNLLAATDGFAHKAGTMRTRQSICIRKARYASELDALVAAAKADFPLRPYRCERCRQFHLTSRTKGKRIPRILRISDAQPPA